MTFPKGRAVEIRSAIVAIDGSEPSRRALAFGTRLLRPLARLTVLTVVPVLAELARHADLAVPLMARLRMDAEGFQREALAGLASGPLEVGGMIREGCPADEICRYADEANPDLLILGTRGLSGRKIHLVGSVGYNVAHFSRAPVLLAREDRPARRILAPVDGSEASARAAAWAGAVAAQGGGEVTLLYVIPRETEEVKFTVTRGVGEPFLGPLEKFLASTVRVRRRVEYGRPAETIVSVARDGEYDLVTLGRLGRGGSPAFALGGVTDKVLHYAPCSVLVVP